MMPITAGHSTIDKKLQGLEKQFQDQLTIAQTEQKAHQEQLFQQISDKKEENTTLFQTLQSKGIQVSTMTKTISELARKLQEIEPATGPSSQDAMALDAEVQALRERLTNKEAQLSEIQSEFQNKREDFDTTLRELSGKLQGVEEEAHRKSELLKYFEDMASIQKDLAVMSLEKNRELELKLKRSETFQSELQQQLSKTLEEVSRLKSLEDISGASKLQKELADAQQRIINLTVKLREAQAPANNSEVLDQLAQQLAQVSTLKDDINQLKLSGKTYGTVTRDLAKMLGAKEDDIMAPDSLVEEPELPESRCHDPANGQFSVIL
ncbi:hypothetical protein EsH8_II_001323 [Colletotrichum jinshuiense]